MRNHRYPSMREGLRKHIKAQGPSMREGLKKYIKAQGPSMHESLSMNLKARKKRECEKLKRMRMLGSLVELGHLDPETLHEPYIIDFEEIWPKNMKKGREEYD